MSNDATYRQTLAPLSLSKGAWTRPCPELCRRAQGASPRAETRLSHLPGNCDSRVTACTFGATHG